MRKQLIALIFCISGITAFPQETDVTLEECMKLARENYPEVKRYDIISATESCNLKNASKNWLPAVSLKAKGGWRNNTLDATEFLANMGIEAEEIGIKPLPHWQYQAGMEVVQPIFDGGATSLQKELAHREAAADRAKIEVSLHALDDKVIDVYFAILLLEDRKKQAALRMELLDRNLEKLRNLQKEDLVKQNDVDAVEVAKLKAQQSIDVLDENLEIYRKSMELLTGKSMENRNLVRPEMSLHERPAFSETAEMQLLDRQSELLSLKKRYEKVKAMPKIGLMGAAYYGFPGYNLFHDFVDQKSQLDFGVGVNISWDISPFYKKKTNLNLMELQQQTINNARELLVYRQRITNTSLETKLNSMKDIRLQDDKIIELCEKLRKAEEVKVDNDMADATELLSKINDESDAKLQRSVHDSELMLDICKLYLYGDTEK